MVSILHQLSQPALEGLADALSRKSVQLPCSTTALLHTIPKALISSVATELNNLKSQGMAEVHIAYMLKLVAQERKQSQRQRDAIDLVWTGEEVLGSESRDTKVVVKELFSHARQYVLISSYALDTGKKAAALFQPLAQRMKEIPDLQVRLFINIKRPYGKNSKSEATLLREFSESFRENIWPGDRFPDVFYDPKSLVKTETSRTCLHAKCVVVDDEKLLVTSANFTEAAHQRNIEAGVLLRDASSAKSVRAQFERLVGQKALCRVPGIMN